jgi:hypothetical protein
MKNPPYPAKNLFLFLTSRCGFSFAAFTYLYDDGVSSHDANETLEQNYV